MKSLVSVFAVLFFSLPLRAEQKMTLEWEPVALAKGYVVQIRTSDNDIKEVRVSENRMEQSLNPGEYQVRLAALNKFGKPGAFTDWITVKIRSRDAGVVRLSRDEKSTDPDRGKPAPPQTVQPGGSEEGRRHVSVWPGALIPGYIQIRGDHPYRGLGEITALSAIAIAFYTERRAGDKISSDPFNKPVVLFPLTWSLPASVGSYFYLRRENEKHRYRLHQDNQRGLAALGLLVYAGQCVDAVFFSSPRAKASFQFSPDAQGFRSQVALTFFY